VLHRTDCTGTWSKQGFCFNEHLSPLEWGYWIVDPQENQVIVLVLQNSTYVERGVFGIDDIASGFLLPELSVDVGTMLNA